MEVGKRARECERVRACVCVCVRACVRVCVCDCVRVQHEYTRIWMCTRLPPQAMACGIPVVTSSCYGVNMFCEHEYNCLMTPATDATAMATALHTLIRSPAVRHSCMLIFRGGGCTQTKCVCALKGVVLLGASYSGKIALAGSCRLRSTLAAAPVLFAHAVVTVAKKHTSATPIYFIAVCIYECVYDDISADLCVGIACMSVFVIDSMTGFAWVCVMTTSLYRVRVFACSGSHFRCVFVCVQLAATLAARALEVVARFTWEHALTLLEDALFTSAWLLHHPPAVIAADGSDRLARCD
jgi:hypothetical protein